MLCQEFHAIGKEGSAVDGKGLKLYQTMLSNKFFCGFIFLI